jgi:hypothetical protein
MQNDIPPENAFRGSYRGERRFPVTSLSTEAENVSTGLLRALRKHPEA